MSVHPNTMLMAHLSPDDLPRRTFLAIPAEAGAGLDDPRVKIEGDAYHLSLMDGYDEEFQITAESGEIVLMDMVTYGYGEHVAWDKLEAQKRRLEAWLVEACQRHRCGAFRISVGANYW